MDMGLLCSVVGFDLHPIHVHPTSPCDLLLRKLSPCSLIGVASQRVLWVFLSSKLLSTFSFLCVCGHEGLQPCSSYVRRDRELMKSKKSQPVNEAGGSNHFE